MEMLETLGGAEAPVIVDEKWYTHYWQGYLDARCGRLGAQPGRRSAAYEAGIGRYRLEARAALRASERLERG